MEDMIAALIAMREPGSGQAFPAAGGERPSCGQNLLAMRRRGCYHASMQRKGVVSPELADRLRGCLMGLMCGDALGAPLEFHSAQEVAERHPGGVRGMVAGWGDSSEHLPGDTSDDTEMAITLLHSLLHCGGFNAADAFEAYHEWLDSAPLDAGLTISDALSGESSPDSQANGALMRIAPLALFAALHPTCDWEGAAEEDACLTHVHPKCAHANIIYVESLLLALRGESPMLIYTAALSRASLLREEALLARLKAAAKEEPAYSPCAGWVEIAFQSAYYWLLHTRAADEVPAALLAVVNHLGDPDTNAAIVGALLGARFGESALPEEWRRLVLAGSLDRPHLYSPASGMAALEHLIRGDEAPQEAAPVARGGWRGFLSRLLGGEAPEGEGAV